MSHDGAETRPWAIRRDAPGPRNNALARTNRKNATEAEKALWRVLRQIDVNGSHFRRQVVIGRYIADFACRQARLVIEADGGQHCENAADTTRTAVLEAKGWRVVRFWNNDILNNPDGVAAQVAAALDDKPSALSGPTPTPNPSPQGGGE